MATQLTIVNNILARLREDTVGSVVETDYAQLIARFVNDAKADMEDINFEWSMYETTITVPILGDGTRTYELTGTNDRSWLLRNYNNKDIPAAYDATAGEVGQLFDCPLKELRKERALTNTIVDVSNPRTFAVAYDGDNNGWELELLWGSNNARTWTTYWYVPQEPLAVDGSADNTNILLPRRPVELRALAYALIERGEELGPPAGPTWVQSVNAIAAALETDTQVQKKSQEIDITNQESL